MAHIAREVASLLSALVLLPLEECTSDAEEWREDIKKAIRRLRRGGLPPDDPLRYDESGALLSKEGLGVKLQGIIDSWPSWEKEKSRGRTKNHKSYRKATRRIR